MNKSSLAQSADFSMPTPNRRDRKPIYEAVSRLIWLQYKAENQIEPSISFEQCPDMQRRAILEAVEALVNMALDPDRRDAALMCMADALVGGVYQGTMALDDLSTKTQQQYLTTAEHALNFFLVNLLDTPPDIHYRDRMCRLMDALAPKVTQ